MARAMGRPCSSRSTARKPSSLQLMRIWSPSRRMEKLLWQMPYAQGGRYTSATPIVHGNTLIVAGPGSGISAFRLKKDGDKIVEEKIWSNTDNSVGFNTPVLKGNLLVGLSTAGQLFCINIENGATTAWTAPITRTAQGAAGEAVGRGAQTRATIECRPFMCRRLSKKIASSKIAASAGVAMVEAAVVAEAGEDVAAAEEVVTALSSTRVSCFWHSAPLVSSSYSIPAPTHTPR